MSNQQPEENENLLNFIASTVELIRDRLEATVTKEELAEELGKVEARLTRKIEVEITAVRGDIEQVHLRIDAIEKALSSRLNHIEAEMSRMRSVLYLLVKDRPDMLRLLGQAPPAGG
jgi:chromosome segregation ATPase